MPSSRSKAPAGPTDRSGAETSHAAAAQSAPAREWVWWMFVLAPVLFNAFWLVPELSTGVPSKNDSALHLLLVHAASDAVRAGSNPFDFWVPQLELGFPQFVYYQHLPHLAVVALHRALLGTVELETLFHLVRYVLLVAFPITAAWSMRQMGYSCIAAGVGGVAASLFSASARYGFEYNSYVWRGVGLYTQLWGVHLAFLALASVVRTVNEGRGYVRTALMFALLAVSHLIYLYIMALTSALVLVMGTPWRTAWRAILPRTARLAVPGVLAVAMASYMLWPFLQSSHAYLNSLPGMANNYRPVGRAVLSVLQGRLLDFDRLPVLSVLAAIGVVAAVVRRGPQRLFALTGLAVWLVLFLGRPLLDALGGALPSHSGFVSFRFVGAVGMFFVLMIGVGGEALWDAVGRLRVLSLRARTVVAVTLLCVIFAPAFVERAQYYGGNRQLIEETRAALMEDTQLGTVLSAIAADSGEGRSDGRVYAGLRDGWGGQMMVGPSLRVFDVINAHRRASIGNPFQGLALNSGLHYNFRDGDAGLFDAFDVRLVVTPAAVNAPPFFQSVLRTERYAVWRVPTSGITHYVAVIGRRSARTQRELYVGASDWFVSNAPGAHHVTRWDYPSAASAAPFTPIARCPDGGRVSDERVSSQRISLVVDCSRAGAVALKISYHPNWQVQIDDALVPTYMVSPSFIGFDVPAGRHRIEARYVATPSKMPLLLAGLMVLAGAVTFRRRLDAPAQWIAKRLGVALVVLLCVAAGNARV
ncbi:MAG: hypothetical protein ABMA00_03190 [Gemmatimonas sp.]